MNFSSKKYMSRLFGFSDDVEGVNMTFKDKKLEKKYIISNIANEYQKSKIYCIFCVISYILLILLSLFINSWKIIRTFYIAFAGLLIEFVLFSISNFCKRKIRILLFLKNIRFLIFYLLFGFSILFPVNNQGDGFSKFRFIFGFLVYMNFTYIYYLDFNMVMHILVPILNTLLIILLEIVYDYKIYFFLPEIISNFIMHAVTYYVKKYEFSNKRQIFFDNYKMGHYIEYIDQLINILNTMVISVKNKEVLFMNNFAINYFKKRKNSSVKQEEMYEQDFPLTNSFFNDNQNLKLYNYMNSFFESLILDIPFENEVMVQEKQKSLKEIILSIFRDINFESKEFIRIGFFKSMNDCNFFEIHIRKLNFKEEVVEILINDITEVKLAINLETKYKQKILAKIAHEFKTPLITIISLIHKIVNQEINNNNLYPSTKISLNHINYLSNYTLVLISDIIQYVSNSINLKLNKSEIILKEVLDFGFNVLKTLVECNENKVNKIETMLDNDENVEDIAVLSDENRLKQILLNFISNSVKFTISGFIKIQTKYIFKTNSIKISVIDSGLGIKSQDHHQIFKENVQLNVDKEYNSKGSGLGLSITKTLANSLDHEIGFISTIGQGSEFYLNIKCLNLNSSVKMNSIIQKRNNKMILDSKEISLISQNYSCFQNNKINLSTFSENSKKECVDRLNNEQISLTTKRHNFNLNQERFFKSLSNDRLESEFEITRFSFSLGNIISDDNTTSIVVIDDHKLIRDITINLIKSVMTTLNIQNYKIIEGSDGIDLLNIVRLDKEHKIKYILIDENMEFLNGSEAVKILRNIEKSNKIKNYNIISLTAFDDPETKNHILNCGLDSIISKPSTKSQILNIMQNLK